MIRKTDLTTINYTRGRAGFKLMYLVFHYTANDGDTDENNAKYFKAVHRGASAHYFIDEDSVTQVVKDEDTAWHCGDTQKYTNGGATMKGKVRNANSIGIELCSDKDSQGRYIITPQTVNNAVELAQELMTKYNIPITNVYRHYDVSGKICPEPFVRDLAQWQKFKARLTTDDMLTLIVNGTPRAIKGDVNAGVSYLKLERESIPLRTLGEALGFKVGWDQSRKAVIWND